LDSSPRCPIYMNCLNFHNSAFLAKQNRVNHDKLETVLDKQASVGSAATLLVGKGVGHPRERKSACAYNDRARTLPQAWRPGRLHRRQSTAGHPRYARAGFAADPGSTPVCATRARHLRPTNPAAVASPDGAVCLCVTLCGSVWLCVALCGAVWRCVALCGAVWRRVAPCGAVWRRVRRTPPRRRCASPDGVGQRRRSLGTLPVRPWSPSPSFVSTNTLLPLPTLHVHRRVAIAPIMSGVVGCRQLHKLLRCGNHRLLARHRVA